MWSSFAYLCLIGIAPAQDPQPPVVGLVDLHSHLGAHLAVAPNYSPGPDAPLPQRPSYKHRFSQQMFREELLKSGTVLFVNASYEHPVRIGFRSKKAVARTMEKQFAFTEAFIASDPEHFALARNPAEARAAIADGKIVFVHAIESAYHVIDTPEDIQHWADRGVALVTPIHLADSPYGGASYTDTLGWILNVKGQFKHAFAPKKHRGLTPRGKKLVQGLIDAGIVVDVQHMSWDSIDDTLDIAELNGVAPIATHSTVFSVRGEPHAFRDDQIEDIYRMGGMIGIAGNPEGQNPHPARPFWASHPKPVDYCPRTVDDFALHYSHLVELTKGQPVGWGSDWNGGVIHARPKYGKHGCNPTRSDGAVMDAYDTAGLVHIGALPAFVEHLERDGGVDDGPLMQSAERFLQIWEIAWSKAHPSDIAH